MQVLQALRDNPLDPGVQTRSVLSFIEGLPKKGRFPLPLLEDEFFSLDPLTEEAQKIHVSCLFHIHSLVSAARKAPTKIALKDQVSSQQMEIFLEQRSQLKSLFRNRLITMGECIEHVISS